MEVSRTIIISCAGMGNRLGLGTTKALLEIKGKALIIRQLEMLENEKDIRIVVGYQAQKVIQLVRQYREDITFVFNHDYRTTGTGASVALAARYANEYILSLDGDLLVHPDDMQKALECPYEFVSGSIPETDDPWMLQTYQDGGKEFVSLFSKNIGRWEWNGITQMKSAKMQNGKGHVFQLIEPYLPVRFMELRTKEIDTINDYKRAIMWIENGYEDSLGG
ncbi:MAG: NTP transferase domain-containing protein [Lachnospiraceae bacterium]|nr:NTP transferase domain-containing protein [Lachnospiraceae bacterium]MCM1233795.1 NTP transferase domain-containing protein [Ruminococcus flavefaciens]